ncbi:MAG: FtsW/RodA/SpoVE family cell cycle protein, partial [Chitinophagaceae bacterium]
MAQDLQKQKGRGLERLFLLLSAVVLGLMFFHLFQNLQKEFSDYDQRIAEGSMINLNTPNPDKQLQALLLKGYYLEDKKDVELIRSVVAKGFTESDGEIDNIGELNKKSFFVDAEQAYAQGGESFKKRVLVSRSVLGFSGRDSVRFAQEKTAPPTLPDEVNVAVGKHDVEGTIYNEDGDEVAGVLVRLNMILPRDSLFGNNVFEAQSELTETTGTIHKTFARDSAGNRRLQGLTAYARTNSDGEFSFKNLPEGKSYEVLPLQPGFQFGASKGVETLDENVSFSFYQSPHTVRLFSTRDFNNLKKEKALVVRTPAEAMQWFWIIVAVFFASFLLVHLFLSAKLSHTDPIILPVIMLLTGLSLITLISLQDPLRDRFLAQSTLGYFGAGMVGLFVLQFFNLRLFTTDSALYRLFFLQKDAGAAKGWQWAAVAVFILMLMILLGTGPEGSGVKVNLFGFQPSELIKIMMLLFLAGFFAVNEKFIASYATWQRRWTFFSFALIAIVVGILLFLILGDLGPAMVVCFTFIILFSF